MTLQPVNLVAIPWLKKEDWPRWRELDQQLPTYERWLLTIEEAMKAASAAGSYYVKVPIDPGRFLEWCLREKKKVDHDSRSEYAAAAVSLAATQAKIAMKRH
jgi:hypothetical protein